MRTVLVTGANGFVGCNLVKHFAEAGNAVVALDRSSPDNPMCRYVASVSDRIAFVRADLSDPHWHRALPTQSADIVIHAAAVTNVSEGEEIARASDAAAVNVGGTMNVLTWALTARPARIIHLSSSAVYGAILDAGDPIDERHPCEPSSIYGTTKLAAEKIALRFAELAGLELVIARLAGPYGPMERQTAERKRLSPIHAWCEAAVTGTALSIHRGTLPRDWIYIKDTAAAIECLAREPDLSHRIYNVSSGSAVTCDDIIGALRELFPALGSRAVNGEAVNLIARPISSQRLRSATGWEPRHDLRSGLGDYISWMKSN
ncbi:MAG TPA: NAD(P)-dependent oxidoreductase [Pseudolabrys sp.]|nr:NAD(P)-dependent oxidoreductase [Pseudolabrys sp.]